MDSLVTELLRIMGPVLWILPALYIFLIYQRRRDRDRFDMERRIKSEEYEHQQYLNHKMSREFDRENRYAPKMQEELYYRLERLEERLSAKSIGRSDSELSSRLDSILSAVTESQAESADNSEQLIRELSHSLNTPLSQIEVAASIAMSGMDNKNELEKSFQSISDSVQVCKSFLGAFRELVVSGSAAVWNPKSIEEAVKSAFQVYTASNNKNISLKLDLPITIEGYTNNYISALLLPIIENAVESSEQNTVVIVKFDQKGKNNILSVANEPTNPPGGDEIYKQGFTTKDGHEGTGLISVKHLLSTFSGASLAHTFESHLATFTISLPRRIK